MSITIKKIAEMSGLSRGTVDRVINNRGKYSKEAEEKIKKIVDQYGYIPKQKKNGNNIKPVKIGVITQLSSASFMIEVNRGIHLAKKQLKEKNIDVILKESETVDKDIQLRLVDELVNEGVDGLAIMPVEDNDIRQCINDLSDNKIPVVTFNSDIIGTHRKVFVGLDNYRSGKAAAGLMGLMTKGVGKVLVITGYFTNNVNNHRVEGFTEEIRKSFPNIELLGVQSSCDKADEVEKIILNTMRIFPDLDGIFLLSAGQTGLRKAFEKIDMDKRPNVIMYDLTPKNKKALEDNIVDFIIDQDGYSQGYKAVNILSEIIVNKKEKLTELVYTEISIRTKYNI